LRPPDLLRSAEILLSATRGRPTTASLCRATSSAYYALFHSLALECANLLIGGTAAVRNDPAWRQVYRSLEHGLAQHKCRAAVAAKRFPPSIIQFAVVFTKLQEKRHSADYDPFYRATKSEVRVDIESCRAAMAHLSSAPTQDRRAFCAYVLLKDRPN